MIQRVLLVFLLMAGSGAAQAQVLDGFTWVNQKTDTATMESVAHILRDVDYTSVLEVAFVAPHTVAAANGEEAVSAAVAPVASASLARDSHMLAVVAKKPGTAALPSDETISVYDLSLKYETATLLLKGAGLRFHGWLKFTREAPPELVATYQDCAGACQKTTFFTSFYLDGKTHEWKARWPRSVSGAPLFSEGQEANGGQQVYALMVDDTGRAVLGTWQHYAGRAGSKKAAHESDYVFSYHLTQWTQQDVTEQLEGAPARAMQARVCAARDEALGMADGQGTSLCHPVAVRGR